MSTDISTKRWNASLQKTHDHPLRTLEVELELTGQISEHLGPQVRIVAEI